jgi:hypothetical protein
MVYVRKTNRPYDPRITGRPRSKPVSERAKEKLAKNQMLNIREAEYYLRTVHGLNVSGGQIRHMARFKGVIPFYQTCTYSPMLFKSAELDAWVKTYRVQVPIAKKLAV